MKNSLLKTNYVFSGIEKEYKRIYILFFVKHCLTVFVDNLKKTIFHASQIPNITVFFKLSTEELKNA